MNKKLSCTSMTKQSMTNILGRSEQETQLYKYDKAVDDKHPRQE